MRQQFFLLSFLLFAAVGIVALFWIHVLWSLLLFVPLFGMGVRDSIQGKHAVLRNFPLLGRFRYLFEKIRPEINQYFIESNTDGMPYSREQRSLIYQRSKNQLDTLPFGTQHKVYEPGYEWLNHSMNPRHIEIKDPRILVGAENCQQPYSLSLFNISAMSFGSLSKNAILALSMGARLGKFAHNTGEGGISPYHLEGGGDLIWQIGTGYFGCRKQDGSFDAEAFADRSQHRQVKMIELKLSQGAKPGHGGILPGKKVTEEISRIRLVPMGEDVISPPSHSEFSTPRGLLEFVARLRTLTGGKPVGFKLCLGSHTEFMSICKTMIETKIYPDFITIDGGEGGTGAAPLEFSNSLGTPLSDALAFVQNALVGCGIREHVMLFASGGMVSGFHLVTKLALGADACFAARAMMFSLGCIQALRCNTNHCPVGVTTQDPALVHGLSVPNKAPRVKNYHERTIESLNALVGAAGLGAPHELRPWHIYRRISQTEVMHYGQIYRMLESGCIVDGEPPEGFARPWFKASCESFGREPGEAVSEAERHAKA